MNTYMEYDLQELDDGSYIGTAQTNDNLDLGYPTEYADWPVRYKDTGEMLRRTGGGCHYGMYGQPVIVYVDGKLIRGYQGHSDYAVVSEFAGRHT